MNFETARENIVKIITKKQNLLFLLGIFLVAAFWRFYRINIFPAGLSATEYNLAKGLIDLTKNSWVIPSAHIEQALYYYLMTGVGFVSNFNILVLRLFQASLGLVLTIVFYLFTKDWFNKQTALLGTLLFSTSSFVVLMSRNLQPEILSPLVILLGLYVITVAMRRNNYLLFAFTGVLAALLLYTNAIFLFLPLAIGLIVIYSNYRFPQALQGYWRGLLVSGGTFILSLIPYILYLPQSIGRLLHSLNPGSIGGYYLSLGGNVQTLIYQSSVNNLYNVGVEPLLDPFVSIGFLCGFCFAIIYLRRKKFLFLTSWILLAMFAISLRGYLQLPEFVILMPVIYIFSAIMLDYVLTHWVRTFPYNKPAKIMMTFVFSLFLFLSVLYNYQKYFWAWGRNQNIQSQYKYSIEYQKK